MKRPSRTAADPTVWVAHNRDSLVRVQHMQINEQQGALKRGFRPGTRQWPTLCLDQRIAKGRKEKSSVVVSTPSLQVPTNQDPLKKNLHYNEWSKFPQSWNQEVLDEWGHNSN